jgi:alcohol dehydrogenase (cytochrome c)
VALNATTGALIWAINSADSKHGETFTMAPLIFEDLVLIGPAGSENAISGWVGAFRLRDGVVLDVRTGLLLWYKQLVVNDSHDWDLTQVSPLFRAQVNGRERRLLVTAGKDGYVRTLDRDSHELLYSTAVTTIKNAEVPVTTAGVVVCPGSTGGVEWNGPALDQELNLLYVNAVDWCGNYVAAEIIRHVPGRLYMGGTADWVGPSQGWLTALDASTGAIKWQYRSTRPLMAAVTATKGHVIFTGELTGDFLALDARDGKILYRFNTGGGIGGGVVTYAENGNQYVAVMSGRPSPYWANEIAGAPTVFLFGLP